MRRNPDLPGSVQPRQWQQQLHPQHGVSLTHGTKNSLFVWFRFSLLFVLSLSRQISFFMT